MPLITRITDLYFARADKCRPALDKFDIIPGQLILENIDLILQGFSEALGQVFGLDVRFDTVGAPVKSAFAPAGKIEHGLTQGLTRDRAGVYANAAQFTETLNDGNTLT